MSTEVIVLIPLKENDSLLKPFELFQYGQSVADDAKEEIYSMLYAQGITNKTSFKENKAYIYSLMEATLPEKFIEHNKLFRKYERARKFELDILPPLDREKVETARELRHKKITQFLGLPILWV